MTRPLLLLSFFLPLFAAVSAACDASSASERRLGTHEGSLVLHVYTGEATVTQELPSNTIELANLGGAQRRVLLTGLACAFVATEGGDGQYEGFALEGPACQPPADLLSSTQTLRVEGGNVSFYENGDGDPLLRLWGHVVDDTGAEETTWDLLFASDHVR